MIRALTHADFPSWEPLWLAYLRFYRQEVPGDVTAATFRRLCDQADGMAGLVATDELGALVGIAHLVSHPSAWSAAPYCYLEDLFVHPSARGTGAARELLDAVFAARRRGAARTYWETQEFNGPAAAEKPARCMTRSRTAPHSSSTSADCRARRDLSQPRELRPGACLSRAPDGAHRQPVVPVRIRSLTWLNNRYDTGVHR